jgi:hypothetical protein
MAGFDKVFAPWRRTKVRPLEAGLSIGPTDKNLTRSACCFAKDRSGQTYLLTAASIFGAPVNKWLKVVQPSVPDGGTNADVVGEVLRSQIDYLTPPRHLPLSRLVAAVKLASDIRGENSIPGRGYITDQLTELQLTELKSGTKVVIVGRSSTGTGIFRFTDNRKLIHIRAASGLGVSGAPVLTIDNRLIGLIIERGGMELLVVPVAPVLRDYGLEFLPETAKRH